RRRPAAGRRRPGGRAGWRLRSSWRRPGYCPVAGSGPPPAAAGVARCPIMDSDRRTFLGALAAGVVVLGGGVLRPARAEGGGSAPPAGRLAVVPVTFAPDGAEADVRLPFPVTHVGLRWRGSEDDALEIRWPGAEGGEAWQRPPIWDDAG